MVSDSTLESVSIRYSGQETDEVIAASLAMFIQIDRVADNVARRQARQPSPSEQHDFADHGRLLKLAYEVLQLQNVSRY